MIETKLINILDYGSYKFRLSVYGDKSKKLLYSNSKLISNDKSVKNILSSLIKETEKKISSHIENVIIVCDSAKKTVLDISIKKKYEKKVKLEKVFPNIVLETMQLINNSDVTKNIIHLIPKKFVVDNIEYFDQPSNKILLNNILIEFKIILFQQEYIETLKKNFNQLNLHVHKIYCASYVKSKNYFNKIKKDNIAFLDIGWERTSLLKFNKKGIENLSTISLGGNHITKDISKVFKVDLEVAEEIKKLFGKSNTEFSYNISNDDNNISIKEILNKNISIDILKKVILFRVQEIIDLSLKSFTKSQIYELKQAELFLIGEGSRLLNTNSFYLIDQVGIPNISFFDENDADISNAAIKYFLDDQLIRKKKAINAGYFEKFFNIFDFK